MLFYASPIFYTVDFYGEYKEVLACTPLVAVLTQMRHALIDPSAPSLAEVLGGAGYVLIPIAITLAIFAWGSGCSTGRPRVWPSNCRRMRSGERTRSSTDRAWRRSAAPTGC